MARTRFQLGSGGWLFMFVALLILGAAVYTQANLLFWSFGLMVGGFIVSLGLSIFTLRKVTVTRLAPTHGVVGEALVIRYRLVNRKRLLPVFNIVVREHFGKGRRGWLRSGPVAERPQRLAARPAGWVLHLGANQTVQAEAACWPMRRGMLQFEAIELSTTFPFGIVRRVLLMPQADRVLIYPRLYRMNRRLLGSLTQGDLSGRKRLDRNGGNDEFFGLRAYRHGDSLKVIDWKHSARTGALISREFTLPSPPKIMLMLDLTAQAQGKQPPPPTAAPIAAPTDSSGLSRRARRVEPLDPTPTDPIERAICLAASLICDAYFYGYQIGLVVRGARCPAFPLHHSLPHRTRLLEALAMLDTTAAGDDEPLTAQPTVIVHAGDSDRPGRLSGAAILGAARLEHYVRMSQGAAVDLLSRQTAILNRREELEHERQRQAQEVTK